MVNVAYIIAGLVVIISFAMMILFGAINYRSFYQQKYNIGQCFPFEMCEHGAKFNIVVIICYIVFSSLMGVFYFYVFHSITISIFKLEIVLGILTSALMLAVLMIRILSDKIHLAAASIYMGVSIANSTFLGYVFIRYSDLLTYNFLGYIMIVLALFQCLVLLNPYLKKWANLVVHEDGSTERPKIFILAFSEWLFIIINVVEIILLATGIK